MAAGGRSLKTTARIRTLNPVHQFEFRWKIDNATKFSRRLNSHEFPEEFACKPRFKVVAKFNEKYAGISNVNIGLQRADQEPDVVLVTAEVSLCNIHDVIYRTKNVKFTSVGNESPHYSLSELFTTNTSLLEFQSSFSYTDKPELTQLKIKDLVGSYKHEIEVFVLPVDQLFVKGVIKTYGCCVVTETLPSKNVIEEYTKPSLVSQMLEELKKAYLESQFTDVELIVEGKSIPVHRYVLSLRSPVFKRMFVEYDTQEKSTGKVDIPDMEKQVLEDFVWYLYTGEVKEESWAFMCALYAAAEKYEVYSLKTACSTLLTNLVDKSSACGILELADLYSNESLKQDAMNYLAQYFSKVQDNDEWKSIMTHNPKLAAEVLTDVSAKGKGKVH